MIRVSTTVPVAKMKGGRIFWVINERKAVMTCPTSQTLPICTVETIIPVSMWAVKMASIKTGVREYWRSDAFNRVGGRLFCTHQRPYTTTWLLILVEITLKACISFAHRQMWGSCASCLRRTQLMQSLEVLAFPKKYRESLVIG